MGVAEASWSRTGRASPRPHPPPSGRWVSDSGDGGNGVNLVNVWATLLMLGSGEGDVRWPECVERFTWFTRFTGPGRPTPHQGRALARADWQLADGPQPADLLPADGLESYGNCGGWWATRWSAGIRYHHSGPMKRTCFDRSCCGRHSCVCGMVYGFPLDSMRVVTHSVFRRDLAVGRWSMGKGLCK